MVRLLITRRTVALDRTEEYLELWRQTAAAAGETGGHAWLFRGSIREDHALEFIEDPGAAGVLDAAAVLAARDSLNEAFPADLEEEWHEWTRTPSELDET